MTTLVPLYPESNLWLEQGSIRSVNLSEFEVDDFITIALPDYPVSVIDENNSFVDFTSNDDGNFSIGPTDSVAFASSLTTLFDGDSEFRFEIGELSTIDLSSITGVRFRIDASGADDFRVLAIRAVSKDWKYAPIDMDTIVGRCVSPVSLTGETAPTYEPPFEGEGALYLGSDTYPSSSTYLSHGDGYWPDIFKSATTAGNVDPQPIDSNLVTIFNTGSQLETNTISLFMREMAIDYITQFELDGTLSSELDGVEQPDYGEARTIPRTQIDLDAIADSISGVGIDPGATIGYGLTQSDLNALTQETIEDKPDYLSAVWIEVRLSWSPSGATVEIFDAESPGSFYSFDLTLVDQSEYAMFVDLEGNSMRISVYERNASILGSLVLDSGLITDVGLFKRRKGRVGWNANLNDGDAYIDSIDPRYLNFAEYQSTPYGSFTPVEGASLTVGATRDSNLVKGINPGPWGGTFIDNHHHHDINPQPFEHDPFSFTIRNSALKPLQGIQTNFIYFDDLRNTELSFNIYITKDAADSQSISAFFWDGYRTRTIPLPFLKENIWNVVKIDLAQHYSHIVPGYYTIVLVQTLVGIPNEWSIDKLSVIRRNISWAGRALTRNVWNDSDGWIKYNGLINSNQDGVLFEERSTSFQIGAKALRQDSSIAQINVTPKYSTLGRQTFDSKPVVVEPVVGFTPSISGLSVDFTSDDNTNVIQHIWYYGDGVEGIGKTSTHTYELAGDYTVTLVVILSNGDHLSSASTVTVS